MPLYQESTFHDRQCGVSETLESTSSTTFVNVSNATMTTKNLGSTGSYTAFFSILMSSSLNNTTATFQLLGDGSPIGGERVIILKVKDLDVGYTLLACTDIDAEVVLQLQWKTDIGTITSPERSFIVDGVPLHRVVL